MRAVFAAACGGALAGAIIIVWQFSGFGHNYPSSNASSFRFLSARQLTGDIEAAGQQRSSGAVQRRAVLSVNPAWVLMAVSLCRARFGLKKLYTWCAWRCVVLTLCQDNGRLAVRRYMVDMLPFMLVVVGDDERYRGRPGLVAYGAGCWAWL